MFARVGNFILPPALKSTGPWAKVQVVYIIYMYLFEVRLIHYFCYGESNNLTWLVIINNQRYLWPLLCGDGIQEQSPGHPRSFNVSLSPALH
jgi:hypothetical protein